MRKIPLSLVATLALLPAVAAVPEPSGLSNVIRASPAEEPAFVRHA